jgi:muramoyltetrapeptide carboxypeptidase
MRTPTIAVTAPSHAFDPIKLEAGLDLARGAGLDLVVLPDVMSPHRYLAHDDPTRLRNLRRALGEPGFDAFWAVRGGSGITRLLRHLDLDALRPRLVIGFSDLTPLLEATRARTGARCLHAPVLHSLAGTDPADRDALFRRLRGEALPPLVGESWHPGEVTGPLVGGNLTMLAATCGTPFQVDARGAILFLEDVGEHPYRIDRCLQQLLDAGVLDQCAGVALGSWDGCDAPKGASWRLEDVLAEVLLPLRVPMIAGLPCGHGSRNHPLVIGATYQLGGGELVELDPAPLLVG